MFSSSSAPLSSPIVDNVAFAIHYGGFNNLSFTRVLAMVSLTETLLCGTCSHLVTRDCIGIQQMYGLLSHSIHWHLAEV